MKKICLLFVIIACAICCNAVSPDSLAWHIDYQRWIYPQEKVHITTDRDSYVGGDTIRFRAFLTDAATLLPATNGSRFVYVELTDPFGKNAARVKLRAENGLFAGRMPLPEHIAEGTYTLNAYTLFQENQGKDYFFSKPLNIRSRLALKYNLTADYDADGKGITVSLSERGSGKPVQAENISAADAEQDVAMNIHRRVKHHFRFPGRTCRLGSVKVMFDTYHKFFALPATPDSISVTFHPEGGYLIPDTENVLAFKALNTRGLGCDISGAILTEAGDTVAPLISAHRGMGAVKFTPAGTTKYFAAAGNQRFPIPQACAEAATLRVRPAGSDSLTVAVVGRFDPGMILMGHNRGRATVAIRLTEPEVRLPLSALGSGITQLLLVDKNANTLSSRMVFTRGDDYIADASAAALDSLRGGDYAVAIYGDSALAGDLTSTLAASLLLQGDLAGHIENPASYLTDKGPNADRNLDLLMLTNGWQRYNIPSALKGNFSQAALPMEIGGEIEGIVRSRWKGKPMANARVCVLAPSIGFAQTVATDKQGRFAINGIDWPDETPFAFQVYGHSGNREHNYVIDADIFPQVNVTIPNPKPEPTVDRPFSAEGTVLLNEISVTGRHDAEQAYRLMMESLGARSVSASDIADKHITSYEEAISNIPGIRVEQGTIMSNVPTLLNGKVPVELWVDGIRWESTNAIGDNTNTLEQFAGQYPISTVESMTYLRPAAALAISLSASYGGGALVITTINGAKSGEWDRNLFMHVATPLGYQKAAEVYKPHFLPDPTDPDGQRTLRAWYPRHASPADLRVPRGGTMIIEGHDSNGRPVSLRL